MPRYRHRCRTVIRAWPGTTVLSMPARRIRTGPLALVLAAVSAVMVSGPSHAAYPRPGDTSLVTRGYDGTQAKDPVDTAIGPSSWETAISGDGRFVAFSSTATNLVPGDANGASDIFVRDMSSGKTDLISVGTNGVPGTGACANGNLGSLGPSISQDGRYVAFSSCATNLVDKDLNLGRDAFVRDRLTHKTAMVSLSSSGTQGTLPVLNHDSFAASISPEGRYVAISSNASDLVPGDTNAAGDAFLVDRASGKIQRISVSSSEQEGTSATSATRHDSSASSLSANGRFAVFTSNADNLVADDTNAAIDVFVRDVGKGTTERVSVRSGGAQSAGGGLFSSGGRAISADGRYVMFHATAPDLVPNDSGNRAQPTTDIFVHDRLTNRTERVSVGSDGQEAHGSSAAGSISLDGRYVGISSNANNLTPGDTGSNGSNTVTVGAQPGDEDVYVYDRKYGSMQMMSVAPDGTEATGHCKFISGQLSDGSAESNSAAVSADGKYVAFQSCATNLVPGDTNLTRDVFRRNRGGSVGASGVTASGGSSVTFHGWASLSGSVLASAADPANDGAALAVTTGAELTGGEMLYRPEEEDLFIRLNLTQIPSLGVTLGGLAAPGDPRVLYGVRFVADGVFYEVRVARAGVGSTDPLNASFGLFTCTEQVCTPVAALTGGYGTTGEQIVVSVPLSAIVKGGKPFAAGGTLSALRAYTALGSYLSGPNQVLDDLVLSKQTSLRLPGYSLTVSIGGQSQRATLSKGRFTVAFPRGVVGARRTVNTVACLGHECSTDRLTFAL